MVEGLWEPAGTKLGQSQQPEHRAGLSSQVLFSDGWGRTHCVPWSHLITDLMLGMDPGALPEADWDVLSTASLRGSIPGSRAAASLCYQDKLEEHGSFYGLLRAGQPGGHHKRILCKSNIQLQRFGRECTRKNVAFGQFAASWRAVFSELQARKTEPLV